MIQNIDSEPSITEIRENRSRISEYIVNTPVLHLAGPSVQNLLGAGTELYLKLETFQPTGSFKVRSVLTFLQSLDQDSISRGFVTLSAGNHAAAVAYGARCLGTSAKVIMPKNTNPRKIALSSQYGATIILLDDIRDAFQVIEDIEGSEGRVFVPAWGSPLLPLGTASLALELIGQTPPLDVFIVAIGAGSVCSGTAPLVKSTWPECRVLAGEPEGAPTMFRSFQSGKVEFLDKPETIAEGLSPPQSCELFLSICRDCVDELRLITDKQIVHAMRFLFEEAKQAVEPSGAGAMAAALGPYREQIAGQRVAVVVSGSNIDFETFSRIVGDPKFNNK